MLPSQLAQVSPRAAMLRRCPASRVCSHTTHCSTTRHLIAFRSKKIDLAKDFVHCGFKYTWQGIPVTDPTSSVRPAPAPPTDFAPDVRAPATCRHVPPRAMS